MATRFAALLHDIAGGLEATHRSRVRILEELSADLDDLYETFRAEGLPHSEARRRAEALVAPSPDAVGELAHLHRPIGTRVADRFSGRLVHRAERGLLVGFTLLGIGATAATLYSRGLLRVAWPFLAAVLAIGGGALALTLAKAFQLYLHGEHRPGRQRAGLGALLTAAVAAVAVAGLGVLAGLASTASAIQAEPSFEAELFLAWVRNGAALAATGVVVALGCGLAWMIFTRRAAVIEHKVARLLGRQPLRVDGSSRPPRVDGTSHASRNDPPIRTTSRPPNPTRSAE